MRRFAVRPTLTLHGRKLNGIRGWAGKPARPPLTDFPVAAYVMAAVFDVISTLGRRETFAGDFFRAGTYVMIGGAAVDIALRLNVYHTRTHPSAAILALSILIAALVSLWAAFGGALAHDYSFNVEAARDGTGWHQSETKVLPGDHNEAISESKE